VTGLRAIRIFAEIRSWETWPFIFSVTILSEMQSAAVDGSYCATKWVGYTVTAAA